MLGPKGEDQLSAFLFAAQVIAAGTTFSCTPIAVYDGDGPIWCAEGPKIRTAGTAAREINGVCKPGHPCPAASGIAARDALVRELGGAKGKLRTGHIVVRAGTMRCQSDGSAVAVARRLVHHSQRRGPELRHGADRHGAEVGTLLAGPSLLVTASKCK